MLITIRLAVFRNLIKNTIKNIIENKINSVFYREICEFLTNKYKSVSTHRSQETANMESYMLKVENIKTPNPGRAKAFL